MMFSGGQWAVVRSLFLRIRKGGFDSKRVGGWRWTMTNDK